MNKIKNSARNQITSFSLACMLALSGFAAVLAADAGGSSATGGSGGNGAGASRATTDPAPSATAGASPKETNAAPSKEGLPNWLNEYAPPKKSEPRREVAAPQNRVADPKGSADSKDAPEVIDHLDFNPPPPGGVPVSPVHAAAPVHSVAPAAARKPIVLQGRLEELGGSGAKLPVGLIGGMQKMEPKLDPKGIKKPPMQAGLVASFPMDWRGTWGGQLKIHWTQIDPIAWQFDPEETAEIQKILTPGISGTVNFNFNQQKNTIQLQPASIVFPARVNTSRERALQQEMANSPLGQMLGGAQGKQLLEAMSSGMPVLVLGAMNGRGVTGNQLASKVFKNDIRQLKEGVLEQNIVVSESDKNTQTGKVQQTYSETVLRFTKLSQNQLYVQAASVKYRNDGHFESKVLLYGTVNRGQSSQYQGYGLDGMPNMGIPGLPGSGMPPGGAGNLNDFGNLLKQLQGLQ